MNVNTLNTILTTLRNDAAHSSLSVAVERDRRGGNAEILGAKLVYPPGGCEPIGIALILDDGADAPEPVAPFWEPSPPSPLEPPATVALPETKTAPPSSDGPRTVAAKRPTTAGRKSTRST